MKIHNNSSFTKLYSLGLLLISTFIWGGGFVWVKILSPILNPFETTHIRFFIAAIFVIPYIIYVRWIKKIHQPFKPAMIAGALLYFLLTFQTVGLYFTSVAKAGFLTTMYVVFIPMLLWVWEKRKFSFLFLFCCLLSVLGIFLLNDANFNQWNKGDTLVLICAVIAAVHIIYIEKIQLKIKDPFLFNAEQCFMVALMGGLGIFLHDTNWITKFSTFNEVAWMSLLGLSIFSSLIAFSFQVYAQKNIPSQTAGILFLLESPFAALIAYIYLGEILSQTAMVGALIIAVSAVLTVFKN